MPLRFLTRASTLSFVVLLGCGSSPSTQLDAALASDAAAVDSGEAPRDAGPRGDGGTRLGECPAASAAVFDPAWAIPLRASPSATYCVAFFEGRTLREELELKAMLHFTAGEYAVPEVDGTFPFSLPACITQRSSATLPTTGSGTVTHTMDVLPSVTQHHLAYEFALANGDSLEGGLEMATSGAIIPFELEGREAQIFLEEYAHPSFWWRPAGAEPWGPTTRHFDSCTFPDTPAQFHHVTLGGEDEVHLELHIGQSFASTEPGAFVRAHGRFAGTDFDQSDYFHLVYNPTHHHFSRDFAVFFDAPIDGACGIEIAHLETHDQDSEPDVAYAVDCELGRLRELSVTSHVWQRPETP